MKNKPDAILSGDIHYRDSVPECRKDDYLKAQNKKISFITKLSLKYDIPIYVAGDLMHKAYSSKELETSLIKKLRKTKIKIIPGNHDLIAHSWDNFDRSSIGIIDAAISDGESGVYRQDHVLNDNFKYYALLDFKDNCIILIHEYVHSPKNVNKMIEGYTVKELFAKFPSANLIVSGDNHLTFTKRIGEQLLVNPGSMMRMSADQANHKPCVFLWYAATNEVEQVFLPIEDDVIDASYLDKEKDKDNRVNAFVERMNTDYELSLSFQENMKSYLKANKVRPSVEDIIWRCIDG